MVSQRVVAVLLFLFFVVVKGDILSAVQYGEIKHGVRIVHKNHLHRRLVNANQAFRISVHYDSSLTTGIPESVKTRIQDIIIPRLKKFLESSLMVRPVDGPILLDRDCVNRKFIPSNTAEAIQCADTCEEQTMCGQAEVPSDHLKLCIACSNTSNCVEMGSNGAGINDTDFLLYVSAKTVGSCPTGQNNGGSPSTIAFAVSCQMESDYDRPIAGNVNFCPNAFNDSKDDDFIFIVAKHEILHALAFATGLFPYWRDENGNPRTARVQFGMPPNSGTTWSNTTIREVQYDDWEVNSGGVSHTVYLLVTPAVVAEGRDHFDCPTLEGVELENQGGSGTMLSHWEKRILGNEFMTGVIDDGPVISRFTFALLQDSGWYTVNYTFAEELFYGRGAGCTFANRSCLSYINEQKQNGESISPFCEDASSTFSCSVDRRFIAKCGLRTLPAPLPPAEYQYFDNVRLGGDEIADFCPIYTSNFQIVSGETSRGTECSDPDNQPNNNDDQVAETYGPGSRCFEHGSSWRRAGFQSTPPGAGCYETSFDCESDELTVSVRTRSQECTPGQRVEFDVAGYTGTLLCPELFEGFCLDNNATGITVSTDPTDSTNATDRPTDSTDATGATEGGANVMPSLYAMMIGGLSLVVIWSAVHGTFF